MAGRKAKLSAADQIKMRARTVQVPGSVGERGRSAFTLEKPDVPLEDVDTITPAPESVEEPVAAEPEPEAQVEVDVEESPEADSAPVEAPSDPEPSGGGEGPDTEPAPAAVVEKPKRKPSSRSKVPKVDPSEGQREAPAGQPAALWDTSGGVALPAGWGSTALSKVRSSLRRSERRKRTNTLIPDDVYSRILEYILEQAREGVDVSFGNLAEAALEQIPQDDAGLEVLINEVPDEYFEPNVMKPRSVLLLPDTAREVSLLPKRLKPQGFLRHSGICQTALMLRLLNDLQVK